MLQGKCQDTLRAFDIRPLTELISSFDNFWNSALSASLYLSLKTLSVSRIVIGYLYTKEMLNGIQWHVSG